MSQTMTQMAGSRTLGQASSARQCWQSRSAPGSCVNLPASADPLVPAAALALLALMVSVCHLVSSSGRVLALLYKPVPQAGMLLACIATPNVARTAVLCS